VPRDTTEQFHVLGGAELLPSGSGQTSPEGVGCFARPLEGPPRGRLELPLFAELLLRTLSGWRRSRPSRYCDGVACSRKAGSRRRPRGHREPPPQPRDESRRSPFRPVFANTEVTLFSKPPPGVFTTSPQPGLFPAQRTSTRSTGLFTPAAASMGRHRRRLCLTSREVRCHN